MLRRPGDDEIAGGIHGGGGIALVLKRRRVDEELPAHGSAGGVISLPIDAPCAAVGTVAGPEDDEIACGIDGDGGVGLIVGGDGVDAEFAAELIAAGVVA